MAEIPPPTPPGFDAFTFLITKVFPAAAGAYVRNLFPPRKPFWQRFTEAVGGILTAIYLGEAVASVAWGLLIWGLGKLPNAAQAIAYVDREATDIAVIFLIGLIGMTAAEGLIVFVRAWWKGKIEEHRG